MKSTTKMGKKRLLMVMCLATIMTLMFASVMVMAADTASVAAVVHTVLSALTKIIGGFMVISGIISYVIAKQNDNGPDEHKAITKMAVGLVLILLMTIVTPNMITDLISK